MPRGLPKTYAKMGFKKGWKAYRAKHKKKASKPKSKKRGGSRRMARKKKSRRSYGSIVPTFMKLIRVGSLVAPAVSRALRTDVSPKLRLTWAMMDYTGFNMDDGSFKADRLVRGWMPFISTSLITYAIPKVNSLIKRLIRF